VRPMSNSLAIATVTETLLRVLTAALPASGVNGAIVTATRPDDQGNLPKAGGVNIFLYQVSPNSALRNADLPTRKRDGTLLHLPQAALDLHYLLTFYGEDGSLDQQRLLGCVVRQMHAHPALRHADIVSAQTNVPFLQGSNLADQVELIRFTPTNFSLEEMSKLWSVFLKTDYVLSVAYAASVVLIETDDPPPGGALPVLKRRLLGIPFSLAFIDAVAPQSVTLSVTEPNQITLQGQGLNADNLVAFITPGDPNPIFGSISSASSSNSMTVTLPSGLRPGVNTVQLMQAAPPSSPLEFSPRVLSQSNAATFDILPVVSIDRTPPPGQITVVVTPHVGPTQQVSLIVNQLAGSPPSGPQAFVLPANPHQSETGTFSFSTVFPNGSVPSGTYLARVRVDTVESRLSANASGTFTGPLAVVP
jgi:Pvc16 N-terminal domain